MTDEEKRQQRFEAAARKVIHEGRIDILTEAMCEAVLAARRPGNEVRFIVTRAEDLLAAVEAMMHQLHDEIDEPKQRAAVQAGEMIIELKNGSCILFVADERGIK